MSGYHENTALGRDLEELEALASGFGSAVVLTHPARRDDLMSLGRALRWALKGETRSFTALVGYFHHNPEVGRDEDTHAGTPDTIEDDDPARIILREAHEESLRLVDPEHDFTAPGFTLLAGLLCSRPAALAARIWYWTCRWRAQGSHAEQRADLFRKRFLTRASELTAQEVPRPFEAACLELFDPACANYQETPGPLHMGEALAVEIAPVEGEGQADISRYWASTRHSLGLIEGEPPKEVGALLGVLEPGSDVWKATALLYGFLLQRKSAFKVTPKHQHVQIDGRVSATLATFHPKIYLVERAGTHDDTVSFVGSNNWSDKAVGAVWTRKNEVVGNVEVATAHVSKGHGWSTPSESDQMGQRVCKVARYIYESVGETVGDWCDPSAPIVDVARLHDELASYTRTTSREYLETPEATLFGDGQTCEGEEGIDTRRSLLDQLAPELTAIIERILGLDAPQQLSVLTDLSSGGERSLFGGREPSRYQLDGAIRLLSMLRSGEGSRRGAFLTDEAGLGKTLAAKLCATQLIVSRLLERHAATGAPPPLRVSLIAPARLVGDTSGEKDGLATGWHGHAQEIIQAVDATLAELHRRELENAREGGVKATGVFPNEVDRRALLAALEVRVLSAGGFPRELLMHSVRPVPADPSELTLREGTGYSDPVGDLLFVACSELVVIDESHTFRNDSSYGTRALRFALSLPCPGEYWPLKWDGSQDEGRDESGIVAQRRVLCLSATPFNNRLDDLLTQIGHFAHAQDWSIAMGNARGQASLDVTPLHQALSAWRGMGVEAQRDEARLREVFSVLLVHAYRHLRSSRRLADAPDKMSDAARDEKTRRISDGGPDYVFAPAYSELYANLVAVSAWVRQRESGEQADPSDDLTREARSRLDALLCDLMVQRSRSRALRLTEASDSTTQIDRMFRRPRVPRYPLSLNEVDRSGVSFEANVLRDLYTLLGDDAPDREEEEPELSEGRLDLFAYRLSTLRARLPFGQTESSEQALEQTIRNNLGFQKITLVKRLQSSPYAFLRTILRGLLRRTLFELALLERLLAPLREQTGGPEEDALTKHELTEVFTEVTRSLDELYKDLQLGQRAFISPVTQILGGVTPSGKGHFLCELGGFYTPSTDREVPEAPTRERFEQAYEALREALGLSGEDAFDEERYQACWASRLVNDVAGGRDVSRLLHDISVVMQWTFAPQGSELVAELYQELEAPTHAGSLLYAAPFDLLKRAFSTPSDELLDYKLQIRMWLEHRLGSDARLRALIAWLALGRLAHDELGADVSSVLPGGHRSLIFSEYTDTQEYVLAVLAALDLCMNKGAPGTRRLVDLLAREVVELTRRLDANAAQVRQNVDAPPRDRYLSPVVMDARWSDELVGALETREDDALDRLERALTDLGTHVGRVSAAESSRLLESQAGTQDDADLAQPPEDEGSTQGGDVVEAFSPWYQIAPPLDPGARAEELRARLDLAAASPVDALFATEVLSEGVNLQECGVVIHYDLPWNPTRLIQRNGRVDRRTFELYEQRRRLDKLRARLAPEGNPSWTGPPMLAPRQVFHMTLLPAEPADVALTERVRERLFEKLDTIRALFGLSYWPVVFNQEQAREVLSGELDYETPGFRRREELFRHWGVLGQRAGRREHVRGGAFTLRMGHDVRGLLARRFRDAPDGDERDGWDELVCAGIVCWTPGLTRTVTVRSAPEASQLLRRNGEADERACALSGVFVRPETRESAPEGASRQLVWALDDAGKRRLHPGWLESVPGKDGPGQLDRYMIVRQTDFQGLDGLQGDEPANLGAPNAPTAVAEELLTFVVDLLIEHDEGVESIHDPDDYLPASPAAAFHSMATPWRAHLALPIARGAFRDGVLKTTLSQAFTDIPITGIPGELPNIWLDLTLPDHES